MLSSLLRPVGQNQPVVANTPQQPKVVAQPVVTPTVKPQPKVEPKVQEAPVVKTKPVVAPIVKKERIATQERLKISFQAVNGETREMRHAELWFGEPGTGKTTKAKRLAQELKDNGVIDDFVVVDCHEELTKISLLKSTKTNEQGHWIFPYNRLFNVLTDELQGRYLVILDEFNTIPMSVMKALQPVLDDTEGEFDFDEITYTKNPNVNFILTMNHRDLGISPLPEAIKSRLFKEFFPDLTAKELAKRSGVPEEFIVLISKVRKMFEHLAQDLPNFHRDVRRLKDFKNLTRNQFDASIKSELELSHIEYEAAMKISPEYDNLLNEYEKIVW